MIRTVFILAAVTTSLAFISCEKHDWEETKALFEPHGYDKLSEDGTKGEDGHGVKGHHGEGAKASGTHH